MFHFLHSACRNAEKIGSITYVEGNYEYLFTYSADSVCRCGAQHAERTHVVQPKTFFLIGGRASAKGCDTRGWHQYGADLVISYPHLGLSRGSAGGDPQCG